MTNLFSMDTVFFTFMGYPMSYLVFFGTILNIWCVWLVSRNKILNWPVGILAVPLFMALFYQIQLYSDFLEQIYFLITGFYGWWIWSQRNKAKQNKQTSLNESILFATTKMRIISIISVVFGTLILGFIMCDVHLFLPSIFAEPASFPFLDAFTTVMSFVATILMAHQKIESWILWVAVDLIGIWLYFVKDVKFISLLYVIFLILATKGFFTWIRLWKQHKKEKTQPLSSQQASF